MTETAETKSINLEFELAQPPTKVWRALTEPELLASWLMANDFRPETGQKFNFKGQPNPWWDGVVHCEMLEVELHKRLRFTWRGGPIDTVVTWTLTPTASGGTRLGVEQSGFAASAGQASEGAKMGWQRMAGKLAEVLAQVA